LQEFRDWDVRKILTDAEISSKHPPQAWWRSACFLVVLLAAIFLFVYFRSH
jgi:hypothetical protein